MNTLGRIARGLRMLMGMPDSSESPLTPSHGWLLPVPAEARSQRRDAEAQQAARADRKARA
jgi:hypothetical protein